MHNINTTNFKNVNRLYPNGIIKGLKEINIGFKWIEAPELYNNKHNDFKTVLEHLKHLGCTGVCLIIENEYKQTFYPDYRINELI